jgi:dienelactone hydrolase
MKIIRSVFIIIMSAAAAAVLLYAGYGVYIASKVNAMPEVKQAIDREAGKTAGKDMLLTDKSGDHIVLPGGKNRETGIIIYPAAFSDETSYIPVAFKFAGQGYSVFIAKMPFRLSMFDTENALNYTGMYKEIKKWYIIGHSMGGIAASVFAEKHPGIISGIIFWASGPLPDMKDSKIRFLLISGTRDGFFPGAALDMMKKRLPAGAKYYTIQGGNHSQFAWYPDMPGDLKASVSREEQQKQAIGQVLEFIK